MLPASASALAAPDIFCRMSRMTVLVRGGPLDGVHLGPGRGDRRLSITNWFWSSG